MHVFIIYLSTNYWQQKYELFINNQKKSPMRDFASFKSFFSPNGVQITSNHYICTLNLK